MKVARQACFAAVLLLSGMCPAQDLGDRVLVVYNGYSKASKQVARHYAGVRRIPGRNLCAVKPATVKPASFPTVTLGRELYERDIRKPIRKCLERAGKERVLYIVLTVLTPYRLEALPQPAGRAIDSYLADPWDQLPKGTRAANPYFAEAQNKAGVFPPFESLADYRTRPDAKLIYSVWRLDAPSVPLALGLVEKAVWAEKAGLAGRVCIDRRSGAADMKGIDEHGYGAADWDLFRAAELARQAGFEVVEDSHDAEFGTAPAPARCDDAAFYAGWYSLNAYHDVFSWNTGAIGFHLDSLSAMDPRGGKNWSANAIRRGITVTAGAVEEPYIQGLPRPGGVFRDLLAGATVGDALLRNTPWLRWNVINLGDPLYRPFPGGRTMRVEGPGN